MSTCFAFSTFAKARHAADRMAGAVGGEPMAVVEDTSPNDYGGYPFTVRPLAEAEEYALLHRTDSEIRYRSDGEQSGRDPDDIACGQQDEA